MKERVLILTNTFGKWGETNGVVRTYKEFLKQFKERNIPVDIITYGPEDDIEEDGCVRIMTHKPKVPFNYDPLQKCELNLMLNKDITRIITNTKYKIVHSASPDPTLATVALTQSFVGGIPLVSVYHALLPEFTEARYLDKGKERFEKFGRFIDSLEGSFKELLGIKGLSPIIQRVKSIVDRDGKTRARRYRQIMEGYERLFYNASDLILFPTKEALKTKKDVFRPKKEILSRGINLEEFNPKHRTREDDEVVPIYVGRVVPEKNMELLAELAKKHQEYRFRIIGTGSELKRFDNIDNVECRGRLYGKDLSKEYANGDIFIFPSETDTFGQVVREAMASGLPVIVSDKGGPKEQVKDGYNGFIAKSRQDFDEKLGMLLSDNELRDKMGKNAFESVQRYSWKKVFETLLEQYDIAAKIRKSRFRGKIFQRKTF